MREMLLNRKEILTHATICETGWGLGPFAAVLAPGQTSPQATKYKEAIGTKNNCAHCAFGANSGQGTKRPKSPTATSEELGAKTGCREHKQGTVPAPLHSTPPKGWAKHLSPHLWPDPWTRPYPHPI